VKFVSCSVQQCRWGGGRITLFCLIEAILKCHRFHRCYIWCFFTFFFFTCTECLALALVLVALSVSLIFSLVYGCLLVLSLPPVAHDDWCMCRVGAPYQIRYLFQNTTLNVCFFIWLQVFCSIVFFVLCEISRPLFSLLLAGGCLCSLSCLNGSNLTVCEACVDVWSMSWVWVCNPCFGFLSPVMCLAVY